MLHMILIIYRIQSINYQNAGNENLIISSVIYISSSFIIEHACEFIQTFNYAIFNYLYTRISLRTLLLKYGHMYTFFIQGSHNCERHKYLGIIYFQDTQEHTFSILISTIWRIRMNINLITFEMYVYGCISYRLKKIL